MAMRSEASRPPPLLAMPDSGHDGYAIYLLTRLGQFVLVVFIGINIAFIVTHATPIDPVEQIDRRQRRRSAAPAPRRSR